jgi:hypothetical protein
MIPITLEELKGDDYNKFERALTLTILDEILTPTVTPFDEHTILVLYLYNGFVYNKLYALDDLNSRKSSFEQVACEIKGEAKHVLRKVIDRG